MLGDELAGRDPVLDARRAHDSQDGHELLLHERMGGQLGQFGRQRREQDLRVLADGEAAHRGQVGARLAQGGDLHAPVGLEGQARDRIDLGTVQHACAHALQLGHDVVVDRVVDDQGLLGRADDRGVEGLGDEDVDDGHAHVGARVQVDRRVAGADAHARLARLVGGLNRLGAAGRPDEVHARVMEEVLRDVERRIGDHLQGVGRQSRRLAGLLQDLDRALGAAGGARRRPEDDRVARLGRDDRLEQRRRGRVGDGQQPEHDADRLGHLLDVALGVLADDADRALVLEVVVEELGGDVVLEDLVLEDPEPGLLHGELGEVDGVLEAGDDHRPHDRVDGLLVQAAEGAGGGAGALDVAVQALGEDGLDDRCFDGGGHQAYSSSTRSP